MIGYAIYLTQSRGALLGVAALGLLVANKVLGTMRTLMLAAVAVAAVGALSFGGQQVSTKEESAAQRIEAWEEGLNMLRSKPILGVGYGNFTDHHYLTAHNSFVLCFAELGLVGYFAWMGLIVLTYKGLLRAVRLAPWHRSAGWSQPSGHRSWPFWPAAGFSHARTRPGSSCCCPWGLPAGMSFGRSAGRHPRT